uniref:Uncharacterized protein n=1 Tax=Terrapene triunguis TaxID=2587831 RepID=A0A674K8U7_9SAUR
ARGKSVQATDLGGSRLFPPIPPATPGGHQLPQRAHGAAVGCHCLPAPRRLAGPDLHLHPGSRGARAWGSQGIGEGVLPPTIPLSMYPSCSWAQGIPRGHSLRAPDPALGLDGSRRPLEGTGPQPHCPPPSPPSVCSPPGDGRPPDGSDLRRLLHLQRHHRGPAPLLLARAGRRGGREEAGIEGTPPGL